PLAHPRRTLSAFPAHHRPAPGVGWCALVRRLRSALVRRLWCFDLRRTGRAKPTCCQPDIPDASAFGLHRADLQGPVGGWRGNLCQSVGLLTAIRECFTMALAFGLQGAGFTPTELSTEAAVTLEPEGQGFRISRSALTLHAKVPNLDETKFANLARDAEKNCPVSKVLKAEIVLDAKLA